MTTENAKDDIKNRFFDLTGYAFGQSDVQCAQFLAQLDSGLDGERDALIKINSNWIAFVLYCEYKIYVMLVIPSANDSAQVSELGFVIEKYLTRIFPQTESATAEYGNNCVRKVQEIFPSIAKNNVVGGVWRI